MRSDWREVVLGEVADLLTGHPFKSQHYTDDKSAPRLLGGDNIVQGSLRWENVRRWPNNLTEGLDDYWLRAGDVVLAMDRPWIEAGLKRAAINEDDVPSLLIQRTARLRGSAELDTGFLRYVISSNAFTQYVLSVQTGTAVPHISPTQIRAYSFLLPPIKEQQEIAAILGALDDKIELNRRMNGTLEAMAQALFKEWFVDGAKEEWEESPLTELGPIIMGNSPKGDTYNETGEGTPLINGPVEYGEYFPVRRKWTTDPTRLAQAGDLIFCVRGSTTGRTVVADGEYAIGRGVCAMRSKHRVFLYQTIAARLPDLLAKTTGSVFPSLSSNDIKDFPVLVPPVEVRDRFEKLAGPFIERIEANQRENVTLTALRDTLLPKLMRGEVRVKHTAAV